ncbi:MAG: endonuclease Q family protein [Nitrospirota bacterium]|nr:endonuclease Q family protein [Nitrospirota bacterium]
MSFIADLHVHSKYSRATSQDMSPEGLWRAAQLKGIRVIATGDFTHPAWIKELKEKTEPGEPGLFSLKNKYRANDVPASCAAEVSFILSAEISCIYSKNGKTRKVHAVVLMPDFASAERLNASLAKIGNLHSDGRPILGLDAKELLRMTLDASPEGMFIPAHVWTPWFSVFGAMSGFDTMEECFEDLTPHIHAIETGLSSDPAMNWRLSKLDDLTLVSNSDAHSAAKLGREANIFDTDISYGAMIDAIKTKQGFGGTIEFFPEEGKYHYDGHRDCGVSLTPRETVRNNYLCPSCGKRVTVGVMHRVDKLADREEGFRPKDAPGYSSIIPLAEIIAETLQCGVNTKKVRAIHEKMLDDLGNEFSVLLKAEPRDIEAASTPAVAEAVTLMRAGKVRIAPGYDGEYGKIRIFERLEQGEPKGQIILL